MNKLATALVALGFIPALGTFESGSHGEQHVVNRGAPNRYDLNNGVTVVYDGLGAPWVTLSESLKPIDLKGLIRDHDLRGGVYVPHSNAGGAFLRGRMPSVGAMC